MILGFSIKIWNQCFLEINNFNPSQNVLRVAGEAGQRDHRLQHQVQRDHRGRHGGGHHQPQVSAPEPETIKIFCTVTGPSTTVTVTVIDGPVTVTVLLQSLMVLLQWQYCYSHWWSCYSLENFLEFRSLLVPASWCFTYVLPIFPIIYQ